MATNTLKKIKSLRHQLLQYRKEMKKRKTSYKRRRYGRVIARNAEIQAIRDIVRTQPVNMPAPENFSLVDNTNKVVGYLNDCRAKLHKDKKITIDISQIESLSTDAIALLVACVNDNNFLGKYGQIIGNAPSKIELTKLFVESGFYQHVQSENQILKHVDQTDKNLLHRESHVKVQSDIAKKACQLGTKHVFNNESPFPIVYEMLIEAMSNTNNHANREEKGKTKWWLYVYNAPNNKTCYSFVDLGVGIFDSVPVALYKKVAMLLNFSHNADLVKDLLEGRIKSREKIDQNIRGKGIPQIARNSESDKICRAYIISNDVKIDLKTKSAERLENNFNGTFLYWELINPQNIK